MNQNVAQSEKTKPVVVFGTGNLNKLHEVGLLLGDLDIDFRSQAEFDVPEADETGVSYVENALIKAYNAAKHSGLPSIADDSGLMIDALEGKPGVFAHRFASKFESQRHANQFVVDKINDNPSLPRGARFVAYAVYVENDRDPLPIICHSIWEGAINNKIAGDSGFGYDPIFIPNGQDKTVAELDDTYKSAHSHRALAFRQLFSQLKTRF